MCECASDTPVSLPCMVVWNSDEKIMERVRVTAIYRLMKLSENGERTTAMSHFGLRLLGSSFMKHAVSNCRCSRQLYRGSCRRVDILRVPCTQTQPTCILVEVETVVTAPHSHPCPQWNACMHAAYENTKRPIIRKYASWKMYYQQGHCSTAVYCLSMLRR